jgi:hypothetical protein
VDFVNALYLYSNFPAIHDLGLCQELKGYLPSKFVLIATNPGMVMHAYNSSTQEAEAGGL